MIRVLIADDHHLFRDGVARLLQEAPGIELIGAAADGEQAIKMANMHQPDVILVDVNLADSDGIETAHLIQKSNPDTLFLVLTISERSQDLFRAIRMGARGYLLKTVSTQDLLAAIRQVYTGGAAITPSMAGRLVDEFAALSTGASLQSAQSGKLNVLTDREREVLRLVARGMSNKEIGTSLSISPLTVKSHLRSILEKLNLRGRVEAAAWAIRHGLLRGD